VVRRELEGGFLEVKELTLPAVVTIQTGGNAPRYASIMGIKRAGAKTIDQQAPAAAESRTRLVKLYVPPVTSAAQMLEGTVEEKAQKLAALLKDVGVKPQ
jgi:electron transfer flavoprotein beta subunit